MLTALQLVGLLFLERTETTSSGIPLSTIFLNLLMVFGECGYFRPRFLRSSQQLPSDYKSLNLGRTLINPQRADFAIEVFDNRATDHTGSPVNLNRFVDYVLRRFGRE